VFQSSTHILASRGSAGEKFDAVSILTYTRAVCMSVRYVKNASCSVQRTRFRIKINKTRDYGWHF
jgi:hypothetical protein